MASKRSKKGQRKSKAKRPKQIAKGSAKVDVRRALVRPDGGPTAAADVGQEIFGTERASASPMMPAANDRGARPASPTAAGVEGPFRLLLDWFSTVATNPRSAADGVARAADVQRQLGVDRIEAIVAPSDRMTALDRMGIYQYAYHARLIGCLDDDYPSIKAALGDAQFELLARKYIEAFPSDQPNLNGFGRHFAKFCGDQTGWLTNAAFIRDLARLEWAMVEVIHAAPAEPVSMDALQATPPELWGDVCLPSSSTLRFLELEYPANAFLQSMREGERPAIPSAAWSAVAVYRQDYRVWRMGFTKPMAEVLKTLVAGGTLGEAMGRLEEPFIAAQIGESDVMIWFKEWVMGGFFAEILIPPVRTPPV